MLVLVAMLGAAAVRAETEPVIVTDVFGDYQLYRYLHPWPSGARARDLNTRRPMVRASTKSSPRRPMPRSAG
jgi:hypothetical protein